MRTPKKQPAKRKSISQVRGITLSSISSYLLFVKPRLSAAEKQAQKAQARKQRADEKQRQKDAEAEERLRRKAQDDADRKQAKEDEDARKLERQKHREANKLVKPLETLADITIILSQAFSTSHPDFAGKLHDKMHKYEAKVQMAIGTPLMPEYKTIRWKKHITKEYRPQARTWVACEPRDEFQQTALLWLTATELLAVISRNTLFELVDEFRQKHKFEGPKDYMFILLQGLGKQTAHCRGKAETALAELQVAKHTFHVFAQTPGQAAGIIWNLSRDIGYKQHK